ncbi:hypothetical protein [Geobacillus thermodenitrificans]|uniref:hypothetical protein n=1 Tax=Geobacillus thermodenitrificans TaxID=33940 RepID=UPI002E1F8658|nr:hypothetical protein [Geobacillus thermodenitrificans]
MKKNEYRGWPGPGAVEFARQYVEGLTREEALPVIKRLLKGELHDPTDKRIKRCAYCGYYYRDKTKPNNSKTCSRECKIDFDTLNRKKKRADQALLNPKKKKETTYVWWLEYPFYISEYEMLKRSWKCEVPYAPDKLAEIRAAQQRNATLGGKRKPKCEVNYNGDEKVQPKVSVNFGKTSANKPCEVTVSKMTPEEIEAYFTSKYSEKHLKMERWRAENFSRSKKGINEDK